ncbi:DUF3265 domain-containing protein [Vibrio vulnificus]|nr:DUF3265 domain-containing protein [Vibrio vulnificus]RZP85050.1 DUF3265 domain-containing protein [Vibrio vulnificus]
MKPPKHNKAFKRDSCRVAFLACGDLSGENGLRKVGLGGIRPLTRRYVLRQKIRSGDEKNQCNRH